MFIPFEAGSKGSDDQSFGGEEKKRKCPLSTVSVCEIIPKRRKQWRSIRIENILGNGFVYKHKETNAPYCEIQSTSSYSLK
jgi:hypothetical protein